jgi:hypothetical protein
MEESTAAMLIRHAPIDLRMQLKALAAMQHRRLRDVAIEALKEKAEEHARRCTNELSLLEQVESYHQSTKGSCTWARTPEPFALPQTPQGFTKALNFVGPCVPAVR